MEARKKSGKTAIATNCLLLLLLLARRRGGPGGHVWHDAARHQLLVGVPGPAVVVLPPDVPGAAECQVGRVYHITHCVVPDRHSLTLRESSLI